MRSVDAASGTYVIDYDDGDEESGVIARFIRTRTSESAESAPAAAPRQPKQPVKQELSGDYAELRKRYLEPRVYTNAELAMGAVLRRQTRPASIDTPTEGWRALKAKIAELDKKGDDVGVYTFLKQIAEYDEHRLRYSSVPPALRLHCWPTGS